MRKNGSACPGAVAAFAGHGVSHEAKRWAYKAGTVPTLAWVNRLCQQRNDARYEEEKAKTNVSCYAQSVEQAQALMARPITFSKLLRRKPPAKAPRRERTCEHRKHRPEHDKQHNHAVLRISPVSELVSCPS